MRLLLPLLMIGLAGCFFDDKKRLESVSTFEAGPIQLVQTERVDTNGLGLTSKKVLTLKTCLVDKATLSSRAGERFEIESGGRKATYQTDVSGCLHWQETVQYEPLAPENLVQVTRTIEGLGGRLTLHFAVNPWVDGNDAFTDVRYHPSVVTVPEVKSAHAVLGQLEFHPRGHLGSHPSNLTITHIEFLLVDKGGDGKASTRELKATLSGSLIRQKKDGSEERLTPTRGKVRVHVALLEKKTGETKASPLSEIETAEPSWIAGRLSFDSLLSLKRHREENSELILAYRVEPITEAGAVLPAAGEFTLPPAPTGKMSGQPVELKIGSGETFPVGMDLEKPAEGTYASFIASDWNVSFSGSRKYDPKTWEAETSVKAHVCLIDPFSRAGIVKHPFSVAVTDEPTWNEKSARSLVSDEKGCLTWVHTVSYPYAAEERYLDKFILIRSEKAPYRNTLQKISIALNPWQKGPLVFWDTQRLGKPDTQGSPSNISVEIAQLKYTFDKRQFEVSPHLYLTVIKEYTFHLKPFFKRRFKSDKGEEGEDPVVENTRFRLVGAILENTGGVLDRDREADFEKGFIAGFETEVETDAKRDVHAHVQIPIEFSHLPKLESRLRLAIQLIPLGQGSLPQSTTFSTTFLANPRMEEGSTPPAEKLNVSPLVPTKLIESKKVRRIENRFGSAYALSLPWQQTPYELFTQFWSDYSKVSVFEIAEKPTLKNASPFSHLAQHLALSEEETRLVERAVSLSTIGRIKAIRSVLAKFCLDTRYAKECKKNPERFLQVYAFDLVDELTRSAAEVKETKKINFGLNASFIADTGYNEREVEGNRVSNEFTFGVNGKLGYEHFGNGGGLNSGFTHKRESYRTEEAAVSDDFRKRIQVNDTVFLRGDARTLEFVAKTRQCVFVRPLAVVQVSTPGTSILLCSGASEQATREQWVYLKETAIGEETAFGDPTEHHWTKLIRGESMYDRFHALVTDKTKLRIYRMKKVSAFKDGVDSLADSTFTQLSARERLKTDGAVFPGTLQFVELSSLLWTEPEIRRYIDNIEKELMEKAAPASRTQARFLERIRRYSRCVVETIAREHVYPAFLKDAEGIVGRLDQDGTVTRCEQFALKGGNG